MTEEERIVWDELLADNGFLIQLRAYNTLDEVAFQRALVLLKQYIAQHKPCIAMNILYLVMEIQGQLIGALAREVDTHNYRNRKDVIVNMAYEIQMLFDE